MTNISASLDGWQFAWQLAQREMRGSLRKFRVFLGALLIGVAAIGTVGSVAESMRDGINDNARILLGGDLEISSLHTPPSDEIIMQPGSVHIMIFGISRPLIVGEKIPATLKFSDDLEMDIEFTVQESKKYSETETRSKHAH